MKERERKPEIATKKTEYNFEEGVEQVVEKINSLLLSQNYVVVAISGPLLADKNIGKTFLSDTLDRRFQQQDIPYISVSDENSFRVIATQRPDKGVIILGAMGSPSGSLPKIDQKK